MKRTDYITILVCLLAVAVTVLVARCPRTVPLHKCSEVYQRYAGHEGIAAAYIQDFPVNDTLTVEVTLLEATTDSGWAKMQEDFNITPIPPEALAILDTNGVSIWDVPKRECSVQTTEDTIMKDLVVMQYFKRKLAVFNIVSNNQKEAIISYQIKSTSSNTNKK